MMEDDIAEMGEEVQNATQEEKNRLYERVEELKRSNAFILAENDLFERFISRLDPKELLPQDAAETLGGLRVSQLEVLNRGRKQRTRSSTPDRLQQLTIEQKCSVARREVADTRSDLETLTHSSERTLEHYRAILEEAQVRLTETRKDTYEFERDAAKPLRENKEEMMAAEKVLRYLLDKMKTKDNQVEKLRLKNQALRTQSRKLQVQLRQRRETEEDLNEAEFQHQTIRNREHVGKIDDSNKELLRLKLLSGSTQQLTSNKQKKLQSVTCESQQLSNDIANRKDLLLKIEAETVQVQEELSTAERLNQKLCSQLAEYSVPGVLQYMQVKDRHNKLQGSLRTWERKMELAEMTMKTSSKSWNHQRIFAAAATKAEAFQPSVNLPNIVTTTTIST